MGCGASVPEPAYREVVGYTKAGEQIVLMYLRPGQGIKSEIHENLDQTVVVREGCVVVVTRGDDGEKDAYVLSEEEQVVARKGREHGVYNPYPHPAKLVFYYEHQQHPEGLVQFEQTDEELPSAEEWQDVRRLVSGNY